MGNYLKEQFKIAMKRYFFLFNPGFWKAFTRAVGWDKFKVFLIWPEEDW